MRQADLPGLNKKDIKVRPASAHLFFFFRSSRKRPEYALLDLQAELTPHVNLMMRRLAFMYACTEGKCWLGNLAAQRACIY